MKLLTSPDYTNAKYMNAHSKVTYEVTYGVN
jgi:hypothetical protein